MVPRLAVCAAYIAGMVAPALQCVVTVCRMSAGHSIISSCRPCHICQMPCMKVDLRLVHPTYPSHSSPEPVCRPGSVYNVVDDDPAGRAEVVAFARRLLNPGPPRGDDIKCRGSSWGHTAFARRWLAAAAREPLSAGRILTRALRERRLIAWKRACGSRRPGLAYPTLPLLGAMPVLRKSGN